MHDLLMLFHQLVLLGGSETAELTQNCGAQLSNKTHFYCEKLNAYEHLFTNFVGASAPLVLPFIGWI